MLCKYWIMYIRSPEKFISHSHSLATAGTQSFARWFTDRISISFTVYRSKWPKHRHEAASLQGNRRYCFHWFNFNSVRGAFRISLMNGTQAGPRTWWRGWRWGYLIKSKDSVENVIETTGHASSSLYVIRAVQEFRFNVVFSFSN